MTTSARNFRKVTPGSMRFVCDLEVIDDALDDSGSPVASYSTFAAGVYFDFYDSTVYESVNAQQIEAQQTSVIVIRYRPGMEGVLPNRMRLKHVTNIDANTVDYYDIKGAIRDSTMRWALQLNCTKRDATGFRTGLQP